MYMCCGYMWSGVACLQYANRRWRWTTWNCYAVAEFQVVGIMSSMPTGADSATFHLIFQFVVQSRVCAGLPMPKDGKTTHQSNGTERCWCRCSNRLQFLCVCCVFLRQLYSTPEKKNSNEIIILAQFRGFSEEPVFVFVAQFSRNMFIHSKDKQYNCNWKTRRG